MLILNAVTAVSAAFQVAVAQPSPTPPPVRDAAMVATAVRAGSPPVIDGTDADPIWADARKTGSFVQFDPKDGAAPTYQTEFRVAFDDRNLYVFVRAFDDHPDSIMHALT